LLFLCHTDLGIRHHIF